MAQYPAFCGEYNSENRHKNLRNEIDACKRELATLFTHITYESGGHSSLSDFSVPVELDGLKYPMDDLCTYWFEDGFEEFCQFIEEASDLGKLFPGDLNEAYYGRGPLHLRWNGVYGMFSRAYYDDEFEG